MADHQSPHNGRFHELRTCLTLISGSVQLAQRSASRSAIPDRQLAAHLADARTNLARLTVLLAELQRATTTIEPLEGPTPPES